MDLFVDQRFSLSGETDVLSDAGSVQPNFIHGFSTQFGIEEAALIIPGFAEFGMGAVTAREITDVCGINDHLGREFFPEVPRKSI